MCAALGLTGVGDTNPPESTVDPSSSLVVAVIELSPSIRGFDKKVLKIQNITSMFFVKQL